MGWTAVDYDLLIAQDQLDWPSSGNICYFHRLDNSHVDIANLASSVLYKLVQIIVDMGAGCFLADCWSHYSATCFCEVELTKKPFLRSRRVYGVIRLSLPKKVEPDELECCQSFVRMKPTSQVTYLFQNWSDQRHMTHVDVHREDIPFPKEAIAVLTYCVQDQRVLTVSVK